MKELMELLPENCVNCPFAQQLIYALSAQDVDRLAEAISRCKSFHKDEEGQKISPSGVNMVPGSCGIKGERHELEK